MTIISVGIPSGSSNSTCGYCSPPGQRSIQASFVKSAGLEAFQLSASVYQGMIDRGWRRSGTWCYKVDNKRTCCPHYTIKLDALEFTPSKRQRKIVNRWNRFVVPPTTRPPKLRTNVSPFKLVDAIHGSESTGKFEVTLEPASFSDEKYELFQRYQKDVHNDSSSRSGFKSFLVESPLRAEPIPYRGERPAHLPENYGSYHQLYRLDGELIAMAVLDILPHCVSSVYFMYLKRWDEYLFGKLSALREAALVKEIHEAGVEGMRYLYMGFYIHSCQKMRYKGEYRPSYLADPETYEWFPLEQCRPLLDKHRYASFSHPEHSCTDKPNESERGPIGEGVLAQVDVVKGMSGGKVTTIPLSQSKAWKDDYAKESVLDCIAGLGDSLALQVLLYPYLY